MGCLSRFPSHKPFEKKSVFFVPKDTESLENLWATALSAKLDSSQLRSRCAKLLARMLSDIVIVFSILEGPSQKLVELYYIEKKNDTKRKSQLQLSYTISLWRALDE